ncbi:MAG: 30S ribosomal protein S12 methylthiotransferase RimO [Prevotella sp.]|nr:30S ribosomal protein S12 methylthiotransferase RimO [Prevotella sp.]MCM1075571.1 30S ribosomal protein S12 methylthiotransferase RimO [Ruminococcus sp.]
MQHSRIDIVTMGCSKNLVDSQRLIKRLEARGYTVYHDSEDVCGEVVVVNTCGFIGDAKQESIDMILQLARGKRNGKIGKLMVMGCLAQRYMDELPEAIPEVDSWFGKFNWVELIEQLPDLREQNKPRNWERTLTGNPWSAYLKISEGCNRFCAYCAIPLIVGRHHSRPIDEILDEVRDLVCKGVTEFNVIAQDLSAYGTDIGFTNDGSSKSGLATLIEKISDIPGVKWIRLHYAYPVDFPWDVLEVMRTRENVCNYLDIALQHISTPILKNMRRHIDKPQTLNIIKRIRETVPGICLRTTLMTGFPGEGEDEFRELTDFVKEARFERMGAFSYSEEDDTWAQKHLEDTIPQEIKDKRRDYILELQEEISRELNRNLIGRRVQMLVETVEDDEMCGRTQWDSPEVDCEIHVSIPKGRDAVSPGEYINVVITDADAFDLFAEFSD